MELSYEEERGCGYRKPGKDGLGIYLMGQGDFETCERLPFPISVCPCCGHGIKFSRGFTWIDPTQLFSAEVEPFCDYASSASDIISDNHHNHNNCAICSPWTVGNRAGLMWVGESHYPTPHHFAREAREMGISKKIGAIPRGFEIGQNIIYMAHRKAFTDWDNAEHPVSPGVFMTFKPTHVDLVVNDTVPARAAAIKKDLGDKANIITVVKRTQKTLSFI